MAEWALAQLNIAELLAPIDSPQLADFVGNLDRINALADTAPGFIWRLQDELENATKVEQPFGSNCIVNLSQWESVEALHNYVYRTDHAKIMSRRKEWFSRMANVYSVLWWVPRAHRPDVFEAHDRLMILREKGPGPEAFTFKQIANKPLCDSPEAI